MHRIRHLPIRHCVQPWRRTCTLHVLRRGIPVVHAHPRDESRDRNDVVLQCAAKYHVAEFAASVQTAGGIWLVRWMEHYRVVSGAAVHACELWCTLMSPKSLTDAVSQETKGKTLEELDRVFSVPTSVHAAYGLRQIPYFFKKYIFRQDVQPEQLYEAEEKIPHDLGETKLV